MSKWSILVGLVGVSATLSVVGCGGGGGSCGDSFEPNDDSGAASVLTPGKRLAGLVACQGDEDWFSVSLGDGDQLAVAVKLVGAPEGLVVTVHEPSSGSVIARATPSASDEGLAAALQPGAGGDYLVHVTGVAVEKVDYELEVTVSPSETSCAAGTHAQNGACVADGCDDLGLEPNEDVTGARSVAAGKYPNMKMCQGDSDWFVVKAPPGGGALTVAMRLTGGPDLDLYATDGTMTGPIPTIVGVGQTPGDEEYLMNLPVADGGEVYFFVRNKSSSATASYELELSFAPLDERRDCLTDCTSIIAYDGVDDPSLPEAIAAGSYNGSEPKYLYARRDFAMALHYAFEETATKFPGTNPVFLSDLSQADGKTPGVDEGSPRHPLDAHINGHDADIAYYQTMPDNYIRIICGDGSDRNGNGPGGTYNDGQFCNTSENVVDWPRQAFFLASLTSFPMYHVTGIDETLPKQFVDAAYQLAQAGDIASWAYYRIDNGLIWGPPYWPFHHHHIHTQFWNPVQPKLPLYWDGLF